MTADQALRIVIADDQASVREGLVLLLGGLSGIEVVGAAADGQQALELVAEHEPDAILLDLHMPVLDGIGTTRRLVAEHPGVAIVVLTTYVDDASVLEALRAGARSYLTKDADRAEIARALQAAASGLTVFDPRVHATLLAAASPAAAAVPPGPAGVPEAPDGLTQREAEILGLIAQGLTNGEIAARLFLSNHTVKTHINRIFAKTGSRDRVAAIGYAQRHGLAQPSPGQPRPGPALPFPLTRVASRPADRPPVDRPTGRPDDRTTGANLVCAVVAKPAPKPV